MNPIELAQQKSTLYDNTVFSAPSLKTIKKPKEDLYVKGLLNIKVNINILVYI